MMSDDSGHKSEYDVVNVVCRRCGHDLFDSAYTARRTPGKEVCVQMRNLYQVSYI